MAGNRTLKVPASIVGANGAPKHQMNIAYGLQEQGKSGIVQEPGSYYRGSVSHDSREHTKIQFSATAVKSWAKARAASGETTYKGALKEHDVVNGSKFADAIDAPAVQSMAKARAGTGEVSHDQALEENDDRFGTRFRFSGPAVNARISAAVAAGTFPSFGEGLRTQDALHDTHFFESSTAVILASSTTAAATNTTRTAVLKEHDRRKSSKVAQSSVGLHIIMSDDFLESNKDKYEILFLSDPPERLSFKKGAKKLDERLSQSCNTNQTLKRLIEQIEKGTVNPSSTSGSMTFMLLKKEAATPQMQIVSTAQRLPSTRPSNWNEIITSSPMPIGYNSDVDGKQDGVKPSKAPRCEPTDMAKKEYAAFKTTLAPWYREEKGLEVGDTVYLMYSRVNMNPIVFHEKMRLETMIRLVDSKNVSGALETIAKNEISTFKKASVIIFRC